MSVDVGERERMSVNMSVSVEDEIRVDRAIRSMHSIVTAHPAPGIPEPHTKDCIPGSASIEIDGLGSTLLTVRAVCADCGAYLDQLVVATGAGDG